MHKRMAQPCVLYLPTKLAQSMGVDNAQHISVRFGSAVAKAVVRLNEGDTPLLSPLLRARLHYPAGYKGNVVYHKERDEIHLGPLIGLLTVPFGSRASVGSSALFKGLRRYGNQIGALVYAFTSHDVDWSHRLVRASVECSGALSVVTLPLPDVIYNRVPNRGLERTHHYRNFLRQLAQVKHVYMFNPRFFNKWQVHKWLSTVPEVEEYLPETKPLRSSRDIETILAKYNHAYVKPVGGSLGQGIVRVHRSKSGFVVAYRVGHSNLEHKHHNFAQAAADIFSARHRRNYVVQQGLGLARFRGRTFDVRVTMHRNGLGEWDAVGPAAKVAITGAITTHVHNGGRVYPLKRVLREVFPGKEDELYAQVVKAGKEIAKALEKSTQMKLGELGLDLGITPEGNVYMFEANAKPGRMIFAPVWARRDGAYSLYCVCAYAHYVAGFGLIG
ncbi:MAG: YheC/YheD family protein [Peptococcaceae bacterium]|nr:YheC/YheD family protein [Peptococcaceae bacterium]